MRCFHRQAGVTLAETIIMVLLLVILSMLTNVALKILHGLQREGSRIQSVRDTQIVLYNISQEIRNSERIIFISSDTLQFRSYDFSKGYDWSPTHSNVLYDATKIRTITYQSVITAGLPVLKRTEFLPSGAVYRVSMNFKGILVLPEESTPASYIFRMKSGVASCPCDYVSIHLRLVPPFHQHEPLEYSIDVAARSYASDL